jgi:adenosylhomocysteine nucleosidase
VKWSVNLKPIVVIVSADIEWLSVVKLFPEVEKQKNPYGEWFCTPYKIFGDVYEVIYIHGGWGKISAAASMQFAIDRWSPLFVVNLGTCGGFDGFIDREEIILADRTVVYDIYEQMGDQDAHISHYATELDLSWLEGNYPIPVRVACLVSGDRDLVPQEIPFLRVKYNAIAGDWESGAIAYVARCNNVPLFILRGVSDLVSEDGGEAYGNLDLFTYRANLIMKKLIDALPLWLNLLIKSYQYD